MSDTGNNLGLVKYCKYVLKDEVARKTFQDHWPKQMEEYAKQNIPLRDPQVKAVLEKQFPSQKAAIPSDLNVNSVTVRDESMVRTPPNQDLSAKSDSIFNVGEEKYFQGVMNKHSEWGNHLCTDDIKWMMNETLREDLGEDCQTISGKTIERIYRAAGVEAERNANSIDTA
jgi:hypothetical protein